MCAKQESSIEKKNLLVPRRAKAVLKECAKCTGTFKIITAFDL